MRRRDFIALVGGAAAFMPLATLAQQAGAVRRLGMLVDYAESDAAAQSLVAAFRDELAKLGWAEGRDLRIELRWSAGNADRIRTFGKELVDLRPDTILARGTPETRALCRETQTIPIVFALVTDPITSGFTTSLALPGSRCTSTPWAENG
jgi:putative ABC transport system substrate-binding protein